MAASSIRISFNFSDSAFGFVFKILPATRHAFEVMCPLSRFSDIRVFILLFIDIRSSLVKSSNDSINSKIILLIL